MSAKKKRGGFLTDSRRSILLKLQEGRVAKRTPTGMHRWEKRVEGDPKLLNGDTSALMRADMIEEDRDGCLRISAWGKVFLEHDLNRKEK